MQMRTDLVTEQEMRSCRLCPRECGANRLHGEKGFCGMTARVMAARAALHFWEEPCISGYRDTGGALSGAYGSGTVFFTGCNLRCVYCQNSEIAAGRAGHEVSIPRLAEIFLELQEKGACNINLVTPTPFIPQIAEAVRMSRESGLRLPIVCNCGGYESVHALRLLDGIVDVYLTDFKYMDAEAAGRYSAAPDYPEAAKAALQEMVRQVPAAAFDSRGVMTRGVIVRHLLLPGMVRNAREVVRYLRETYGDTLWVSLMRQYTPMKGIDRMYPELGRRVTAREYRKMVDYALDLGLTNCFIQDSGTAQESFIPAFNGEGL